MSLNPIRKPGDDNSNVVYPDAPPEPVYHNVFNFMLNCDEVTVYRKSMSKRVGTIQAIQWMNGELWIKLHSGGLYPLRSITVKKAK